MAQLVGHKSAEFISPFIEVTADVDGLLFALQDCAAAPEFRVRRSD